MSKPSAAIVCCFYVAGVGGSALAAEPRPPSPGSRIRVFASTVGAKPLVGTLTAIDHEGLTLAVEGSRDSVVLTHQDIGRLDLSRGRRSRGRGALLGAGIGAAAGVLVGILHGSDPKGGFLAYSAGEYALGFAILGAPAGALVGVAIPPRERWVIVPPTRLNSALQPLGRPGFAASVTVAF